MEKNLTLTLQMDEDLVQATQEYAAEHQITIEQLIIAYLERLIQQQKPATDLPILRRLSGILPANVSKEDYQAYLVKKYDQ